MPIYEVALGIVLTTMVGILFVSPIYLFERYILWNALDVCAKRAKGGLSMTNKKFGIIVMDLSLFDFGPKPPCGYIKAKHIRPAYGKGERPVKAYKRITRTREGFRK